MLEQMQGDVIEVVRISNLLPGLRLAWAWADQEISQRWVERATVELVPVGEMTRVTITWSKLNGVAR